MARFVVAALVFAMIGCGKGESGEAEATAKESVAVAKPAVITESVQAAAVVEPRVAAVDPPSRGTIEQRRAIAGKLVAKGFVARTAGPDGTILEVTSKAEGCKLANLTPVVNASGQTMVDAGFTMMRCIGNGDFVELVDGRGAPVAAVGLTAKQLFADYQENEIAADAKYKGKLLRVQGKVTRISKSALDDEPLVELATSNEFMPVYASFKSEGSLAELKRGQPVTVRCRGKGASLGHALLDDCVLE